MLKSLILIGFLFAIIIKNCLSIDEGCDRRPLGAKTYPLPPDNRFVIDILGTNDKYIPETTYNVTLYSRYPESKFIAFTISATGDTQPNEKNPRKPILKDAGQIFPSTSSDGSNESVFHPHCNNTVKEANIVPKSLVTVLWKAPPKHNQCVTIYALIAIKEGVWYNNDGPLLKRICEDSRNADDMPPMQNDNCGVCEEARYELLFIGMWSYNTHPSMFPVSKDLARFSDVVGASHNKNFNLYKTNAEASNGIKMLAEQGNTTSLEIEIAAQLGKDVRTIIKASGQPKPNMTTSAIFRVTPDHHLVSLVTAIIPSPDWFLGVANLELCEVNSNEWAKSVRLNIYPLDAGTDSGSKFEDANEETSPPQPISSAIITKDVTAENQKKPFARVQFNLVRTYSIAQCTRQLGVDLSSFSDNTEEGGGGGIPEVTTPITVSSEDPPVLDPDSPPDCPMTPWEEWIDCTGCINGVTSGLQTRLRYHIVDGVPVGKYNKNGQTLDDKDVPQFCRDENNESETKACEENCEDELAE